MDDKENRLDELMDKRRKDPKERKVPGNLLDVLFKRRKDQEDDYKKLSDLDK